MKRKFLNNPRWLILGSVLSLTIVAGIVKHTTHDVGLAAVVFFRCAVSAVISGLILIRHGVSLWPHRPVLVGLRSFMGVLGLSCYFYALGKLPFGDANMLGYAYPIFVPLLAWPILGEKIRREIILLILISLVGIGLILRPGFAEMNQAAVLGILGSIATAFDIVLVGYLGDREPALRLVFWFMSLGAVGAMPFMDWHFAGMRWVTLIWLLAAGIWGTVSQILATRGFAMGDVSRSVVLVYAGVVMAFVVGVIIWHEVPSWASVAGSLLVIVACVRIMLLRSEKKILTHPDAAMK